MGKKGQNKIPDRWLDYSKLGDVIPDTRFICFKVPLKAELVCNKGAIDRSEWFLPAHLHWLLGERGLRLGLLIDLTNTDRYYDPKDLAYPGLEHVKINVTGQELPSLKEVKLFFEAVDNFEKRQQESSSLAVDGGEPLLIGVHCTHGVNRTGYFVARYLIERKGWSASKAIHEFNYARGHQMEKAHYLAALHEAERNFIKTKQAQIDVDPVNDDSSSSTSDDQETVDHQKDSKAFVGPSPAAVSTAQVPSAAPVPGWQLFQQMMMGVAQMQAIMQMPFSGAAPAEQTSGGSSSDESSGESGDDSDESESSESGDDSGSSTTGEDEKAEGEDAGDSEQAGGSRPGWELGGKVELKPKMTTAQKRRARRRNLREEYKKMRRGKFWEIREMQKKKYGI